MMNTTGTSFTTSKVQLNSSAGSFRPHIDVTGMLGYSSVLLLCVYAVMWKLKRRKLEKYASQFRGPPAMPIVGNGHEFVGSPEDVMETMLKFMGEYESPFKIWIGTVLLICVGKPEDLQVVLNNSKALEKHDFYKFFKNTVGEGLFSAPVHKWRKHRRVITPAFNMRLLESFIPVFNKKNYILIEKLRKEVSTGKHFDLWNYIAPTSLDIICQTAMGYDLKTQENAESEFAQALVKVSELDCMRIYKPWLHPDLVFDVVSYITGLKEVYRVLHKLPMQLIKEKKEEYRKRRENQNNETNITDQGIERKAFLDTLLELNENGANFTDTEMMDEVMTMMIGGSETSALTNCFTLLMLAIHQDAQEKAYNEVYSIFGDSDRDAEIDDLSRMVYLEQCIKETLRLFPVGPLFLRKACEDITIRNHIIPQGASIIIPPIKVHRDPKIYPNPMEWNPENFTEENIEKRHRYSFIAFSGGPRGCIGSKYAMLSMKVLISTVLRNFKITTDVKMNDIKLKLDLLMRSVHGYQVQLYPRRDFL